MAPVARIPEAPENNLAPPPNWFRGVLQGKTRILLAWGFAILLGFLSRGPISWAGIALCLAGASLRYWASGFLRKDQRPAVGGPYAWVRNPLYLGTYLMAVGTAWAGGALFVAAAATVLFAIVYHFIILDEETKLAKLFGAAYEEYKRLVPRFFPRPWPAKADALDAVNPERAHRSFSRELAKKNKAYEAYASFAALITWVVAAAAFWNFS